jgi:hypothetical protein
MMVEKKLSDVVNRLNRTREEKHPNLQEEKERRDWEQQAELRRCQEEKVTMVMYAIEKRTCFCLRL